MGSIWLHDLPTALAGLPNVTYYSGWQNRSRSSGGYDKLLGVVVHHTATQVSTAADNYYQWVRSSERPVGAMYVGRDGGIVVGAAGATNCVGMGGPYTFSRGTAPLNKGNQNTLSIEAGNSGVGEPWPEAQQNAYVALCRALVNHYGLQPSDVINHYEWCLPSCPGRKIDTAGPSRFGSINANGTWDMNLFRAEVAGTVPTPEPEPTPPPGGDWMANLPVIKKGSTGEYVERMQHLLAAAGFLNPANTANYDGVWGNGTEQAKVNFDRAHGLTPSPPTDCGQKSWESLMTGRVW